MRVLVVDDDEAIRRLLSSFFRRRGDLCTVAADGAEALHLVEDRVFDVILSDIKMPEMDGLELVKRTKAVQPHTACVLISGLGTRRDIITALKVGVFDFVDKPITNLAEFTMVMERAAESSRLMQERDALLENLKQQNARLEFSLLRLHEAFGQLRQQEEALESDLLTAQRVQQGLLPAGFPAIKGLDLCGYFGPCEHLGGDFFGTIPLNDGRLAVYLVDVAGHGVSAAMVTVTMRELIRTPQRNSADTDFYAAPARVLSFLNEALINEHFDPPIYVTMVYAVFDPVSGATTLASAGHPAPLWISSAGESRSITVHGAVLGIKAQDPFTEATVTLAPGDTLLFFSDGLPDARNAAGEDFTIDRARETLKRNPGQPAGETVAAITRTISDHLAGQPTADDVTFIAVNRPAATTIPAAGKGVLVPDSVRTVMPTRLRFLPSTDRGSIKGGWHRRTCIIRLGGLATWQLASSLREMIQIAAIQHAESYQIDLAECAGIDSTMIGLLLRHAATITLHQPGSRVMAQLREMGVLNRFTVSHEPTPRFDAPIAVEPSATHQACSELILSAHEALMEASVNNRQQFEDVVAALRSNRTLPVPAPRPLASVDSGSRASASEPADSP
jgi:phosphoserine phosphatase RsbU/P